MSAPRRLLESPQTDPLARKLLSAGRPPLDPPPGASGQVWSALLAQLPPLPPPAPPAAPPAAPPPTIPTGASLGGASSAGSAASVGAAGAAGAASQGGLVALVVKPALLGAAAMGAALGGYSLVTTPPAAPSASVAVVASVAPSAPRAVEPAVTSPAPVAVASTAAPVQSFPTAARALAATAQPAVEAPPATEAPVAPAVSAAVAAAVDPREATPAASAERLSKRREELELTRQGREALAAGNASEALRLLALAQQSGGVLYQEREALTIEALSRAGQGDAASARARAFLAAFPNSPHASRVQSFAR